MKKIMIRMKNSMRSLIVVWTLIVTAWVLNLVNLFVKSEGMSLGLAMIAMGCALTAIGIGLSNLRKLR